MNIWEGVHIKKPKRKQNYFKSEIWMNKSEEKVRFFDKKTNEKNIREHILNILIKKKFKNKVKILDYGGGFGNIYFTLKHLRKNFKIFVYDKEKKIIKKSSSLFNKLKKKILFFHNLNSLKNKKFDIIYFGSVLQYIFNLDYLLRRIKKFDANYIVIYDLMSDNNPDFYSYQNFYGKKMLVKFHNFKTLKEKFNKFNYEIIYQKNMKTYLFGKFQPLLMNNFSKKYKIRLSKQIIFKKKK